MLSDVNDLRENLPMIKNSLDDDVLEKNILDADRFVYDDLSPFVNWSKIEDLLPFIPRAINRLSQYKSCELTIVRNLPNGTLYIGDNINQDNSLYQYWKMQYDELLKKISTGKVLILDEDNEELSTEEIVKVNVGRII